MRTALFLLTLGWLVMPALAQVDFARLDTEIKYALDADGRVLIWPDPATGGFDDAFTPLVRERLDEVIANAGALGLVSYLFCGDTDVASLSDGIAFFARLGRDGDADLLQCIAADDERNRPTPLQRLLAVRVAQDRGFKPAIGLLEPLAGRTTTDAHLRRAAAEAVAALRGRRHDDTPKLRPLREVLAEAPRAHLHLRIDEFRLPAARPLLRSAAAVGIEITRQMILQAGGAVSPATWAGARMLAEAPTLLPYEIARRFGNARVQRAVIAARLPGSGSGVPRVWAHLDGIFDLAAMRAGLVAANLEVRGGDDRIECTFLDDFELLATPTQVRIRSAGFGGVLGNEAAATLAQAIESDDAPIVAVVAKDAALPDPIARLGRPELLAVWLPRQADQPARACLRCSDDRLPELVADEVRGFKRILEGWVDEDERLEILEKAFARMQIEATDKSISLSLPVQDIDLGELLLAVARSGKLH